MRDAVSGRPDHPPRFLPNVRSWEALEALIAELKAKRDGSRIDGKEARRIREAAGCTTAQLAKAIGVTGAAISRWEHANRVPRNENGRRWLAALDRLREFDSGQTT